MMELELTDDQTDAVEKLKTWAGDLSRPFVLQGYAGTGKTTTIRHALTVAGFNLNEVTFVAPTAKAARVMSKKGGFPATTIHKLIYQPVGEKTEELRKELGHARTALKTAVSDQEKSLLRRRELELRAKIAELEKDVRFVLREEIPDCKMIVVDEFSMVGDDVAKDLMSLQVPLILIGDPGQLPPVKRVSGFTDLPCDAFLKQVVRQECESGVLKMATFLRERGFLPSKSDYPDFKLIQRGQLDWPDYQKADIVLCGTHESRRKINRYFRARQGITGFLPQKGEKVICKRNDHDKGLANGEIYWVSEEPKVIDDETALMSVVTDEGTEIVDLHVSLHRFKQLDDPSEVVMTRRGVQEFDFCYAITVHSSQGSEWDKVIVVDDWGGRDRKNWLYTAITRASHELTLIQ